MIPSEVWYVSSEPCSSLDLKDRGGIRGLYIECLKKMILRLTEMSFSGEIPTDKGESIKPYPTYVLPSVIFTEFVNVSDSDYGYVRMTCYRDKNVFRKWAEKEKEEEEEN